MKNKLILIFVLLAVIAVSGCIDSSVDNINKVMPDVSNDIVNGDNHYNDAVNLVNSKNYDDALDKANSAKNEFEDSIKKLDEAKKNFDGINDEVIINYINTVSDEVGLKNNATNYLILSINSYKTGDNETGNSYALQANSLMDRAIEFQDVRVKLVEDNPDLFKKRFHL